MSSPPGQKPRRGRDFRRAGERTPTGVIGHVIEGTLRTQSGDEPEATYTAGGELRRGPRSGAPGLGQCQLRAPGAVPGLLSVRPESAAHHGQPVALSTPGRAIRARRSGPGRAPVGAVPSWPSKPRPRQLPAALRCLGAAVVSPRTQLAEGQAAEDGHRGEAELHRIGEGPIAEGSGADGPPAVGSLGRRLGTGMGSPAETRSKLRPPDTGFGKRLELRVPFPSSPTFPYPQQNARSPVVTAQVNFRPRPPGGIAACPRPGPA